MNPLRAKIVEDLKALDKYPWQDIALFSVAAKTLSQKSLIVPTPCALLYALRDYLPKRRLKTFSFTLVIISERLVEDTVILSNRGLTREDVLNSREAD